jgi:hypothetical protein
MVPNNIVWAFYSASDYQALHDTAIVLAQPEPKDVYYKNTKDEWVKITAVFGCIDEARRNYRPADAKYLGPVYEDTRGEIERGAHYPPSPLNKADYEAQRKDAIRKRLGKKKVVRAPGDPGTIKVKQTSTYLSYFNDFEKGYNSHYWDKP